MRGRRGGERRLRNFLCHSKKKGLGQPTDHLSMSRIGPHGGQWRKGLKGTGRGDGPIASEPPQNTSSEKEKRKLVRTGNRFFINPTAIQRGKFEGGGNQRTDETFKKEGKCPMTRLRRPTGTGVGETRKEAEVCFKVLAILTQALRLGNRPDWVTKRPGKKKQTALKTSMMAQWEVLGGVKLGSRTTRIDAFQNGFWKNKKIGKTGAKKRGAAGANLQKTGGVKTDWKVREKGGFAKT